MPLYPHENFGDAVKHLFYKGTITAVDSDEDTADVTVPGGQDGTAVPLFYHCEPDSEERSNGAIEGAAAAFSVDDEVIVMCDNDKKPVRIVGFVDGIKSCCQLFLMVELQEQILVWDMTNDDVPRGIFDVNGDEITNWPVPKDDLLNSSWMQTVTREWGLPLWNWPPRDPLTTAEEITNTDITTRTGSEGIQTCIGWLDGTNFFNCDGYGTPYTFYRYWWRLIYTQVITLIYAYHNELGEGYSNYEHTIVTAHWDDNCAPFTCCDECPPLDPRPEVVVTTTTSTLNYQGDVFEAQNGDEDAEPEVQKFITMHSTYRDADGTSGATVALTTLPGLGVDGSCSIVNGQPATINFDGRAVVKPVGLYSLPDAKCEWVHSIFIVEDISSRCTDKIKYLAYVSLATGVGSSKTVGKKSAFIPVFQGFLDKYLRIATEDDYPFHGPGDFKNFPEINVYSLK